MPNFEIRVPGFLNPEHHIMREPPSATALANEIRDHITNRTPMLVWVGGEDAFFSATFLNFAQAPVVEIVPGKIPNDAVQLG